MEGNEVPHGWPFGLGSMNSRITAADVTQPAAAVVAPPQPYPPRNLRSSPPPPQPYPPRNLRSSSFSSFSSSNLDTDQSIESFFPDQSVSFGQLIGIKPVNNGRLLHHHHHLCRHHNHHLEFPDERSHSVVRKGQENSNSQGLCAPLLRHVIGMMGRNGSSK